MIRITCPHCAQSIEAEDKLAGNAVNCPTCSENFLIPKLAIQSPTTSKPRKYLWAAIALIPILGGTSYFLRRAPAPQQNHVQVQLPPTIPAIEQEVIIAPEPEPPKPKSTAEQLRDGMYSDSPLSSSFEMDRILSDLALKEELQITDFQDFANLSVTDPKNPKNKILSPFFLVIFGKPDSEYKFTGRRNNLPGVLPDELVIVTDYTYINRVMNPTTERLEDITVRFINGSFSEVTTPSGSSCRPRY